MWGLVTTLAAREQRRKLAAVSDSFIMGSIGSSLVLSFLCHGVWSSNQEPPVLPIMVLDFGDNYSRHNRIGNI